ncbi:M17 family metallopeptidase [Legionella sp. km772]|uniref:leucyl aminopeptidase family protein n=1 Tax=Legionella sp. km772 TaxID=2498111 RepID=UPI000F8F5636|nr:leucyl aminopeptidase family protein [Legionella sp. km772]RUR11915.1 leucyl aminopeptidase family protein [Legionella sp. km772]
MKADLFFKLDAVQATPIYLLSPSQWQDNFAQFTSAEQNYFSSRQFKAAPGESCFTYNADGLIEKAYIGCGTSSCESALAQAALLLPPGIYEVAGQVSAQMALAWALAQYRFTEYKSYELSPRQLLLKESMLREVLSLADAIFLVRDLINKPANHMSPQHLAVVMQELAHSHDAHFEQWVGDELIENNFPAIHAVGRASIHAPRLLSLTWGSNVNPRVTLVGKGVCFDSGGLDIKPSSGMRLMKKDMAGAAHVIGLAQWIMQKQLPIRLQVLVPAVENAIGPDAFRPGDVLSMRNGLTVEIDNTDAEGRLILADALVKACEDKPELLIDFATLTGAARTAVGAEISALFCNNDELAAQIINSSNEVKDPIWRLPLFAAYEDLLNSNIADMANCSTSPYGGAIIAGLFLQRFVSKTTAWLHFDMMGWNLSNKPGKPEGGEAMALRAVAHYLEQVYG